ncbi:unnamed protein product [Lactuca virosa]|uniref:Mechanosensitive ion channel MscS domain-containing protein n=1 Tax=Lactuca virosa TaxID=75947 RepID=A0AAU9LMZ1_9ASTR|nr:unnamed protein product [Lactuca virosa]
MNGISLMMSRSCFPMYNTCLSKRINLIPRRLSNLHLQNISPPVSTTHVLKLKHRVYSSTSAKDATCSRSQVPEDSGTVVPFRLLGDGIIGLVLLKTWEFVPQFISTRGGIEGVLESKACDYILLGALVFFVARCIILMIMLGFLILPEKPISIGDVIEVGCLKGQVIETGPITTSLLTAENCFRIPTYWFWEQLIREQSHDTTLVPYHSIRGQALVSKISFNIYENSKIHKITKEIKKMMGSNSNIYLEIGRPYCHISGWKSHRVELTLVYNLKQMCEHNKLDLVKQDILLQSTRIMKKHGATLVST